MAATPALEAKDVILRRIDCVIFKVENLGAARRFCERVLGSTPLASTRLSGHLSLARSERENQRDQITSDMPQTWPGAFAEGKHLPWTRGMLVKEFDLVSSRF
jgi:hypothetical protein